MFPTRNHRVSFWKHPESPEPIWSRSQSFWNHPEPTWNHPGRTRTDLNIPKTKTPAAARSRSCQTNSSLGIISLDGNGSYSGTDQKSPRFGLSIPGITRRRNGVIRNQPAVTRSWNYFWMTQSHLKSTWSNRPGIDRKLTRNRPESTQKANYVIWSFFIF